MILTTKYAKNQQRVIFLTIWNLSKECIARMKNVSVTSVINLREPGGFEVQINEQLMNIFGRTWFQIISATERWVPNKGFTWCEDA